ncbi:hypothetical protein KR032_000144, partial [Drosophila birchii]
TAEEDKSSAFEKFAVCLCWVFVILLFPLSLFFCIIIVPEYIRLIILRLGRLRKGAKGPGLVFYLPCIDDVQAVDMRTDVYKVFPQEVLTKDSVTITVNAVIYYCIHDAIDSIIQVDNVEEATLMIAKVTLRNIVGSKTLNVLLTSRQALSHEILQAVAGITSRWGVLIERVDIMDISLPASMERSLASEAEAVREARAKIILAEGEAKASQALKEASDVMSQNHITLQVCSKIYIHIWNQVYSLQLRHLQILSPLAAEKRVNIIFPIPLEIMEPFFNEEKLSKLDPDKDDRTEKRETDFPDLFTPKVYIDDPDLLDNLHDPEDYESSNGPSQNLEKDKKDEDMDNFQPTSSSKLTTSYGPSQSQGKNRKYEGVDNSKPTSSWGLSTFFWRKQDSEDAKPSPKRSSQRTSGNLPKAAVDSEPYPFLPNYLVRQSSLHSTSELPPVPPAPTDPRIPPPTLPRDPP